MADFDPYNLPGDAPNPYAPPRADLAPGKTYLPGSMVVEPFSTGAVWRMAWPIFQQRMGLVIGIVIGANIVGVILQVILNLIPTGGQGQGNPDIGVVLVGGAVVILAIVATLWLTLGETIALLKIARGEDASLNDLFSGGRYIVSFILASILYAICVYGAMAIMAIPVFVLMYAMAGANQDAMFAIGIGIGLFVVAIGTITIAIRLYFYQFALVDRGLGTFDSLSYAFKISKGHTFSLVLFVIVASIVAISGVLACGFGLIVTGPLGMLMYACAYVILSNQPEVANLKPPGIEYAEL